MQMAAHHRFSIRNVSALSAGFEPTKTKAFLVTTSVKCPTLPIIHLILADDYQSPLDLPSVEVWPISRTIDLILCSPFLTIVNTTEHWLTGPSDQ